MLPISDDRVCVTSVSGKVLLTLSRMTAGGLMSSITFSILSKCCASRYFLHHSWLSLVVNFEPAHEFHTFYGWLTLLLGVIHGCAHSVRIISEEGHPRGIFHPQMNLPGFVAFLLLLPMVLPMVMTYLKKSVSMWLSEGQPLFLRPDGRDEACIIHAETNAGAFKVTPHGD